MDAVARGDSDAVRRLAHALKGDAMMVGALEMRALCAELERLGRQGRTADAVEVLESLQAAYARLGIALDAVGHVSVGVLALDDGARGLARGADVSR